LVESTKVYDPASGTTISSPQKQSVTGGALLSVTKDGKVYVPRVPPEGGSYHVGDGKAYYIPKSGEGWVQLSSSTTPTTTTEIALAQRQEATKTSGQEYTQYTQSKDVQERLQNIAVRYNEQHPQSSEQLIIPKNITTQSEILSWARENNINPAFIRTTSTPQPQEGMFGGGSISPAQTDIFSRAGMLGATTSQSLLQLGRETANSVMGGLTLVGNYKFGNFQSINDQLKYIENQGAGVLDYFKTPIAEISKSPNIIISEFDKQASYGIDYAQNIFDKQIFPKLETPINMYKYESANYEKFYNAQINFQPELRYVLPTTLTEAGIIGGSIYVGNIFGASPYFVGFATRYSKPIVDTTTGFISSVIPVQDTGLSFSGLPSQVGRGLLFAGTTPLTGISFMKEIGTEFVYNPKKTLKDFGEFTVKNPYEVGTTIIATPYAERIAQTSFFGEKPYQMKLTKGSEKLIEPLTRKSARLFLTDDTGKYILGKSKGEYISIGGGIEKGQTPRQAILSELKQETGLTLKDITNFKSRGKIVFPEETMKIFTASISDINKIKASSDISKVKAFSPDNIFIRDVTGQTALNPVSRMSYNPFEFGRVRSYEAGIINYLEKGIKPTALAVNTKMGLYFLGTQSRYNIPYSSQKEILKADTILLAHGTPNLAVMNLLDIQNKEFVVMAERNARGEQGLFLQIPSSKSKIQPLKFEEVFNRRGKEIFLEIRQPKGEGMLQNKAGTFVKFGEKQKVGYIGLSYLGFKTSQASESMGLKIGYGKRGVFLFEEKPSTTSSTAKARAGSEAERIFKPTTRIKTTDTATIFSIGTKRTFLQPAKVIEQTLKESEQVGITLKSSSSAQYKFITPESITSFAYPSKSKIVPSSLVSQSSISKILSSYGNSSSKSLSSSSGNSASKSSSSLGSSSFIFKSYKSTSKSPSGSYYGYRGGGGSSTDIPRDEKGLNKFEFLMNQEKKKQKKSKIKPKGREDRALTPSFTAQILGITKTIKLKDLGKELNKVRTGGELRPVLRVVK